MFIMVAAADHYKEVVGYDSDFKPGTKESRAEDGRCCKYEPDENRRPPGPEFDVSGKNQYMEGSRYHPRNWDKQGGLVGKFVNWILPYGKATSHYHDTVLNVDGSKSNYGTMPGAWAISTLAGPGKYLRGWEQNSMTWFYMANDKEYIYE